MSLKRLQELKDLAIWYAQHINDTDDPKLNVQFLKKALDNIMWIMAGMMEDIHKMEGRKTDRSSIIVPFQQIKGGDLR